MPPTPEVSFWVWVSQSLESDSLHQIPRGSHLSRSLAYISQGLCFCLPGLQSPISDTLSTAWAILLGPLFSSPSCSISQHHWDIKNVTASQTGAGEPALVFNAQSHLRPPPSVASTHSGPETPCALTSPGNGISILPRLGSFGLTACCQTSLLGCSCLHLVLCLAPFPHLFLSHSSVLCTIPVTIFHPLSISRFHS